MQKKQKKGRERYVPYAKGFRLPTKEKQAKALGYKNLSSLPEEFSFQDFKPIKKCQSIDDWLAQYNELGQTYGQFLKDCPWLSSRKGKFITQTFVKDGTTLPKKYPEGKIYILPLGSAQTFPDIDPLIDYTRKFLQLPVEKLTGPLLDIQNNGEKIYLKFPTTAASSDKCQDSAARGQLLQSRFKSVEGRSHFQIRVHSCLQALRRNIPSDALCVVALTLCDLYEDNPDLFVAGMASGNQRVAIFSLSRYNPSLSFSGEFWYKMQRAKVYDKSKNRKLMLQRGCRLLVHEISHILGIDHCVYFDCCMNGSGHLEEDFSQPMYLCPVDLRKLQTLVGFDVVQRYRELENFCQNHGFSEEEKWYKQRIQSISQNSSKQLKEPDIGAC